MTSKKKFCEDYIQDAPTIFSKDKKISIRIHTLQNLNEVKSKLEKNLKCKE